MTFVQLKNFTAVLYKQKFPQTPCTVYTCSRVSLISRIIECSVALLRCLKSLITFMSDILQCFILFMFNNFNCQRLSKTFSCTFKGLFSLFVLFFFKERIQHVFFVFISKIQNINSTIYFLAMMN